tara:strand:+ start:248 stop:625 length:378 start_codon:yes stop_codon:yes gene_type:complete
VEQFQKLSCNAKQVVIEKKDDDILEISVTDSDGNFHNINVSVKIEHTQNVDILGDKLTDYIDLPSLDITHSTKKSEKYKSTDLSMKWNHSTKPSVFEIKRDDKIMFTGTFTDAMIWISNNVLGCE